MSWLPPDDDVSLAGELDEAYADYQVRARPNPKGTRPRTKVRPSHDDAKIGRVVAVDRGRYQVLVDGNAVTAARARELRRHAIVVGDSVRLVGDSSGADGSLARIVSVDERSTLLRRSADDTDTVERVIVANADQMLIVVAAADPEPRPRLIDRYLVAAYDAGITPVLAITKTDLADAAPLLAAVKGINLATISGEFRHFPLDDLRALLAGHTTVMVGHSGVGKSTLINLLVPGADRVTGHVNAVTGRGRHTSSSAIGLELPAEIGSSNGNGSDEGVAEEGSGSGDRGWIIDTPGVRSFGLGHVDPQNILGAFPDLAAIAERCPRGCTHLPDSPDCAMIEAVESGELDAAGAARLDSLQRLLATLAG